MFESRLILGRHWASPILANKFRLLSKCDFLWYNEIPKTYGCAAFHCLEMGKRNEFLPLSELTLSTAVCASFTAEGMFQNLQLVKTCHLRRGANSIFLGTHLAGNWKLRTGSQNKFHQHNSPLVFFFLFFSIFLNFRFLFRPRSFRFFFVFLVPWIIAVVGS